MKKTIITTIATLTATSSFLLAGSCSGGACGVVRPHIPTDIQNQQKIKPFNFSSKKIQEKQKEYTIWGLVDNGGDTVTGENRLMAGADINAIFTNNDKISLFGLISSEDLTSGKVSYAYPISWNDLVFEVAYINTNYSLSSPILNMTGVGTTHSFEGKVIYPFIKNDSETLDFSLSMNQNTISEEENNDLYDSNIDKSSYSLTAKLDFESKNYSLFNHKLSLGLTAGNLSFDDIKNEIVDGKTANTQGSYTKINIDYKNTILPSENTIIETNFRSQFALNDKNLDDSESFTIGGTNGVKVYEESSVYDSNGFFASIEAKYKLPELGSLKNTVGVFYEYGEIWESDSIISSDTISVQDAGVGIYTTYNNFFSKIQGAVKVGNSDISPKDDDDFRALFQLGFVY